MKASLLLFFLCMIVFLVPLESQAQIHVGVYNGGIFSHVGVGTNVERKYFGELRFLAGDFFIGTLGVEALAHRNLKRTEWYNLHAGILLGVADLDVGRIGVPLGLSFKPIANHRQFALLMEGTPMITRSTLTLRANMGLRYTFRKE